ncbi:MAG: EAL domain-containing protein [Acidimicrobiia bacterium]
MSSDALDELGRTRVRVAIDDFATSYFSFGALAELPTDVLKIDKRFIDNLPQRRRASDRLSHRSSPKHSHSNPSPKDTRRSAQDEALAETPIHPPPELPLFTTPDRATKATPRSSITTRLPCR